MSPHALLAKFVSQVKYHNARAQMMTMRQNSDLQDSQIFFDKIHFSWLITQSALCSALLKKTVII